MMLIWNLISLWFFIKAHIADFLKLEFMEGLLYTYVGSFRQAAIFTSVDQALSYRKNK
jgi:hypothetical protein